MKISKELLSTPHKEYVQQLLSQSLMNCLLKTLEDPIEKHREMTIALFDKLLDEIAFEDKVLLSMLILSLISRLNKIPFAENCKFYIVIYLIHSRRIEIKVSKFIAKNIKKISK